MQKSDPGGIEHPIGKVAVSLFLQQSLGSKSGMLCVCVPKKDTHIFSFPLIGLDWWLGGVPGVVSHLPSTTARRRGSNPQTTNPSHQLADTWYMGLYVYSFWGWFKRNPREEADLCGGGGGGRPQSHMGKLLQYRIPFIFNVWLHPIIKGLKPPWKNKFGIQQSFQ